MFTTQTKYYIQSMNLYAWGFFAQGGLLFDMFGLSFLIILFYGGFLLIRAYFHTENRFQKHRLFYLAAGFGITGLLYIGNIFTLRGNEFYPPGNFVFIPLLAVKL